MGYITDDDGTLLYMPRPNKRVIRRLQLAVKDFRTQELEDSSLSVTQARAVADAAEVLLLEMEPQARQPSNQGHEYDRLSSIGRRL